MGRWWEHLLHNQTALRLKGRLLFMPGVMVTSVPWMLASSDRARHPAERVRAGDTRRGVELVPHRPARPVEPAEPVEPVGKPRDER